MRRIISSVLIFCLLHTSTYAALAELSPLDNTPPTTAAERSFSKDSYPATVAAGLLSPCSSQELTPTDACSVQVSADASIIQKHAPPTIPQNKPYHRSTTTPPSRFSVFIALGITVASAALGGYSVLSSFDPQPAAPTDMCMPHNVRVPSSHQEQLERHRYGASLLEKEIPNWLNENAELMDELGELIHDLRHGDKEAKESWSKAREHTNNAFHNHGARKLRFPLACNFKLGDGSSPDTVIGCESKGRRTKIPSVYTPLPEGVDAQLWLFPGKHNRFTIESLDFIARTPSADLRYPSLDISVDHNNLDHTARTSMRRKLLQAGNTLPLPQAVRSILSNRNDVIELLAKIAKQQRQWNPSTEELKQLNALVKSIFEANGLVMTGDVQCGFVWENGGLELADCALTTTRRAARSFAAQEGEEKVTFRQSLENPIKFDDAVVEANVLPAAEALPRVLRRAETPLFAELDTLRQDLCNPADRSLLNVVSTTLLTALQTPNVNIPEDMACDVMVHTGAIKAVHCNPARAPEIGVCGYYNGTFSAHGRVWIRPDGGISMSANRNWDITPTLEPTPTLKLPVTPTERQSVTQSLKRPHTETQQHTPSVSLPTPTPVQNTTTRMYWIRQRSEQVNLPSTVWGADIDPITGIAGEPWVFLTEPDVIRPCAMYYDAKNGFFYWSEEVVGSSGSNIYAAQVNQTAHKRATLHNTTLLDNQGSYCGNIFIDSQLNILYWQDTYSAFITSPINPQDPKAINKRRGYLGGGTSTLIGDYSTVSLRSKWILFGINGVNGLNTGKLSNSKVTNITRLLSAPIFPDNCRGIFFNELNNKIYFTGYFPIGLAAIYSADITNPKRLQVTNLSLVYNTSNSTVLGALHFPSTIVAEH